MADLVVGLGVGGWGLGVRGSADLVVNFHDWVHLARLHCHNLSMRQQPDQARREHLQCLHKDFRTENGSSRGQNMSLTGLFVPIRSTAVVASTFVCE